MLVVLDSSFAIYKVGIGTFSALIILLHSLCFEIFLKIQDQSKIMYKVASDSLMKINSEYNQVVEDYSFYFIILIYSFENFCPTILLRKNILTIMFFQDQLHISRFCYNTLNFFLQDQQFMIYVNLKRHHETNTISWLWKFSDDTLGKYRQTIYNNKRRK